MLLVSLSSVGSFLGGVVTPMALPSLVTESVRAMARMGMRDVAETQPQSYVGSHSLLLQEHIRTGG